METTYKPAFFPDGVIASFALHSGKFPKYYQAAEAAMKVRAGQPRTIEAINNQYAALGVVYYPDGVAYISGLPGTTVREISQLLDQLESEG